MDHLDREVTDAFINEWTLTSAQDPDIDANRIDTDIGGLPTPEPQTTDVDYPSELRQTSDPAITNERNIPGAPILPTNERQNCALVINGPNGLPLPVFVENCDANRDITASMIADDDVQPCVTSSLVTSLVPVNPLDSKPKISQNELMRENRYHGNPYEVPANTPNNQLYNRQCPEYNGYISENSSSPLTGQDLLSAAFGNQEQDFANTQKVDPYHEPYLNPIPTMETRNTGPTLPPFSGKSPIAAQLVFSYYQAQPTIQPGHGHNLNKHITILPGQTQGHLVGFNQDSESTSSLGEPYETEDNLTGEGFMTESLGWDPNGMNSGYPNYPLEDHDLNNVRLHGNALDYLTNLENNNYLAEFNGLNSENYSLLHYHGTHPSTYGENNLHQGPSTAGGGKAKKISRGGPEYGKMHQRKMAKRLDAPKCVVCGDISSGRHYDVVSDESCKKFFVRYALNQDKIKPCREGGNCVITKDTRKRCQACRMKKCLQMNMNINLIQANENSSTKLAKSSSTGPSSKNSLKTQIIN